MIKRILKNYENLIISAENTSGKLDFKSIFGRLAPVHVEIGSGTGTFLLHQAWACPNMDFIGIERSIAYHRYAVDRIGKQGLSNVRITLCDAAVFLAEKIPESAIDCFHIYFPDPWPKNRHHKRRFINTENTDRMLGCLKKAGIINIATDHGDYFEQIQKVLSAFVENSKLLLIPFSRAAGAKNDEIVGSNYERKYIKKGKPIYTIAGCKI